MNSYHKHGMGLSREKKIQLVCEFQKSFRCQDTVLSLTQQSAVDHDGSDDDQIVSAKSVLGHDSSDEVVYSLCDGTENYKSENKVTVAVEGNIGSGKSSFLQYFNKYNDVEVIPEPVHLWKDVHGHNTLDLMYKDAYRWCLTFQSYVQLTMLKVHQQRVKAPVKLIERSLYSATYCFVENLHRNGCMPDVDYALLSEWFNWIQKNTDIGVDLIVYIRASPETCQERIRKRNRKEESEVPLEYLQSLHQLHEDWLIHETQFKTPAPVLILDGNKDLIDLKNDFEKRKEEILCGYSGDDSCPGKETIQVC